MRSPPVSHSAGLGASVRLPKQGSLQIAQTAAYSPSYLYQLFPTAALPAPGETIPANPDYRIDATDSYSYETKVALAFGSARRTRVTTTAEYSHTDFQHQAVARPNLTDVCDRRESLPRVCHATVGCRSSTNTAPGSLGSAA